MADYRTAEPFFDWKTGDFVIIGGRVKIATGKERVINWVQKVLRTQLNKYGIYVGADYGLDRKGIVGKTFTTDYKRSELRRKITDALLKNKDILSIDDFRMEPNGKKLLISFKIVTEYGSDVIEEVAVE